MEYLEDLRHEGAVAQLGQELGLTLGDGLGELGDEFQLVVGVGGGRGEALCGNSIEFEKDPKKGPKKGPRRDC